jgi:hypothetical protein
MIDILKQSLNDRSGLLIILAVIILAIGGSYRLLTDDINDTKANIKEITKDLKKELEMLHSLDKRIMVLEIKNGS